MAQRQDHSRIVVAGHVCLDVIPQLSGAAPLAPGALVEVGPALLATGGAVSNTGLALHRLGVPVTLMGKVGRDLFGSAVLDIFRRHDDALASQMIIDDAASTSYSVVISPPDADRTFLHCAGANDTFTAGDIDFDRLAGAKVFHFGYPPLMRSIREDGGAAMAEIFREAKRRGVITSLDMAMPDPNGPSGRVDWKAWLQRVLPHVDLFLPSADEIAFMLGGPAPLESLAQRLLDLGTAATAIKLGDQGLYVRTSGRAAALGDAWMDRELRVPCFDADVVGTTGSGDCTIAGFLAGVREEASPEEAATLGVAVGGCSVETADATSGVPSLARVRQRIADGWSSRRCAVPAGFEQVPGSHVYAGPRDRARSGGRVNA